MKLSDASTEIRIAVLGGWVPSQFADVLALQRAEEPETATVLVDGSVAGQIPPVSGSFDFALSMNACEWTDWVCEPLWHDTLAVAVAKRSHLLAYREVPLPEVLKQPLISAQSTAEEPWRTVVHRLFEDALPCSQQVVSTFDMAMSLVSAGYGIAIAPIARLVGYSCRGVVARPLAGMPLAVTAYLAHPCGSLTQPQERFAQRARSVS